MKPLKHVSYSSFKLFEQDPDAFYRRYLAENRPEREPQNHYMAVGSAFDAYVKADLHKRFVNDGDPKYSVDALFETQVEPHNRDRARVDGMDVYNWYKKVGAYADLVIDMEGCIDPRFESELTGEVGISKLEGTVLILGKPDVMYIAKTGARVVHDFKVNGYYSKAPKTPNQGYLKLMPGMTMHKTVLPRKHKGIMINGSASMHIYCLEWAEQLSMYAWVLGEEVGSDYILSVDQLCCNSQQKTIKVAKHVAICNDQWQLNLFARLHRMWHGIKNGHVFLDMTYDENQNKIATIEAELKSKPPEAFIELTTNPKRIR